MTILTDKFKSIWDDVFFCPWMDTSRDLTKIFLQKVELKTGEIIFQEKIDVYNNDFFLNSTYDDYKKYLKIKSGKNLSFKEYYKSKNEKQKLNFSERYEIFKEWISVIAGKDLHFISFLAEIYQSTQGYISASFKLIILFLEKCNANFLLDFLEWVKNECERSNHPQFCKIKHVTPIIDSLGKAQYKSNSLGHGSYDTFQHLEPHELKILKKIIQLVPLDLLFEANLNWENLQKIKLVKPDFTLNFIKNIHNKFKLKKYQNDKEIINNLASIINYAIEIRTTSFEESKNIFKLITDIDLPFRIIKNLPLYYTFNSKLNPGYFSTFLESMDNEKVDIGQKLNQLIETLDSRFLSLGDKNLLTEFITSNILTNISMDFLSSDPNLIESLIYHFPNMFEKLKPYLENAALDVTNTERPWLSPLMFLLEKEPDFVDEFFGCLSDEISDINGKKFNDIITPIMEWILDSDFISDEEDLLLTEIFGYDLSPDLFMKHPDFLLLAHRRYFDYILEYLAKVKLKFESEPKLNKNKLAEYLIPALNCLIDSDTREDEELDESELRQRERNDPVLMDIDTYNDSLKKIFDLDPDINFFKSNGTYIKFLNHPLAKDYCDRKDLKNPQFLKISEEDREILNSIEILLNIKFNHIASFKFVDYRYIDYRNPAIAFTQKDNKIQHIFLDNVGLNLTENLEIIIEKLMGFPALDFLSLRNNNIIKLPDNIGKLKDIKGLSLKGCGLKTIPSSIGNLSSLEYLNLNQNNFKTLPKAIGNLKKLEQLHVQYNKLENIPDYLGNLNLMEYMDLSHNIITELPLTIGKLSNERGIYTYSRYEINKKRNIINKKT